MTDPLYATLTKVDNSTVLSIILEDGSFPIISTYTVSQSHAVIALVVASCISLVATVGLLSAIAISAFNTRMVKDPNMFVRTHVVFYFISLLLSDILQAIGSIMNSAWVTEQAVIYDSALHSSRRRMLELLSGLWCGRQVIATRTFLVLFLRVPHKRYTMWITLIANWSLLGAIVIAGPATTSDKLGPFYGISGIWCWISPNYSTKRIALDYMVMFISALLAFILYLLVFLKMRGIVRAQAHSTSVASADRERNEKYEHKLARQMLLYPIAYTILILPIACCRFFAWTGHEVPFGVTIFSDFIYLMSGLVHVILFASTRRILPPRSMIPKFLISNPQALLTSTALPDGEFDSYYDDATSERSWYATEKKSGRVIEAPDTRNPFADPVLPPIDEAVIRRVRSPDSSEHSSSRGSPRSLSPVPGNYNAGPRAVPLSLKTQKGQLELSREEVELGDESAAQISPVPTHRSGERMELPQTPVSAHRYFEAS
ncbi:hypothetical protein EDB92DRAFT_1819049 [Lactarius akahatsu]|uniref:G-protein coupled receptors family 2 profile 2 domain-containing protein n=1 Tax=Lactarius akahatsu TaxID=416441 RepID=A0AAD4LB54_9AGAM|nr:hypothetical protein EDB92DRAFT_1819049 [Lactarius akahatsu]